MVSWTKVGALAARQYGAVTRSQLVAAGATADQIKGWISSGRIVVLHRGVYVLAGVPPTPELATLAGVLAAGEGAAASHASAAWLWGLVPEPPAVPEVMVPLPRYARLDGVVVHRTLELPQQWIRTRRHIPATDPLRTMLELGGSVPLYVVRDCLERGLMSKMFSVSALEWVRAELAERGRNGCGVLRRVLDDRALGEAPPDGMLEPRLAQLCARYGVERPVFQYEVRDARGRLVGRVDFAYPDVRAFLEVDGYDVHGTASAMEADFDRQNRLVALGWTPIRFGWRVLIRRPQVVAAQIEEVLAMLRSR